MKKVHCIIDKSGSMSLNDKGEIVQQMIVALKQAEEMSKGDFSSSFNRDKFEIVTAEWNGKGENLLELLQGLGADRFILFTDGYFLDSFGASFREKKKFAENLALNKTGCAIIVGADSSEECKKILKVFPGYGLMEALDYVL